MEGRLGKGCCESTFGRVNIVGHCEKSGLSLASCERLISYLSVALSGNTSI